MDSTLSESKRYSGLIANFAATDCRKIKVWSSLHARYSCKLTSVQVIRYFWAIGRLCLRSWAPFNF